MQHSNRYIFIYSAVLVIVVAIVLSAAAIGLKPAQDRNIKLEKMQNILSAVGVKVERESAEGMYKKSITADIVLNAEGVQLQGDSAFKLDLAAELSKPAAEQKYPLFVYKTDSGTNNYIIPMRGKGLWGPVWGYVAIDGDFNTVVGASFAHKGETPGLGAEISTEPFQKQFIGKKIFKEDGTYVGVAVLKNGLAAADDMHAVNGISGGTITSVGTSEMVVRTLGAYQKYFALQKAANTDLEAAAAATTMIIASDSSNMSMDSTKKVN